MRAYLRRAFGCDLRSLATLRIALGLLLLADLAWRLPHFDAWFTEAGAFPIAVARAEKPGIWSLYFLSGSNAWASTLLAISAAAAVALLIGWQTRVVTAVSWILISSLQARNELPINAGDVILRLLLFWGMFVPLGGCWSLDARGRPSGGVHTSGGTAAMLVQVALIYVFNGLYKTGSAWANGTAVLQTLQLETYRTSFGGWLLGYPPLLKLGTHATRWFEIFGPLLPFLPWKTPALRLLTAAAFMAFHVALFATLRIGLFPIICVVAWIPFLPSSFWDRLSSKSAAPDTTPPPISNCVPLLLLCSVLYSNVAGFAGLRRPSWFNRASTFLRIDQRWSLFAPNPSSTEGWTVVVIEAADGGEYDALTGKEIDWSRPANLRDAVPTAQWRKFLAALRAPKFPNRAQFFAAWCRAKWNQEHPENQAQRVRIHYLWEWLSKRQSPPDNWFLYEDPPGPVTELAKKLGYPIAPPTDAADL
jgi:hypothetical protein